MTLQLPIDRVDPSIWYGGWFDGPPVGIAIHSTRSGVANRETIVGHDREMLSTTNWFKSEDSRASANIVVSPRETVQTVPDHRYAWHAKEHSWKTLSIEVTQALATQPYYDEQYERAAAVCHVWCHNFSIPKEYLYVYIDGMKGITGHENLPQGVRDGKSDPGPMWDWDKFMNILRGLDNMPNPNLEQRINAADIFNDAVKDMLKGIIPPRELRRHIRWLIEAWKAQVGE